MKVTTDACLFGAWSSDVICNDKSTSRNVLDIGCGTGLLSLMIAQKNKLEIDGVDIDKAAAEQAMENIIVSPWNDRIRIIHADVRKWEQMAKYDLIVSNPPFYESDLKSGKKSKNLAHHDEGLKLTALLLFIKNHLAEQGSFFLLLPAKREVEINELLLEHNFYLYKKTFVKQSITHTPFRIMIQAGKKAGSKPIPEQISIKGKDNNYTNEFIALLRDFYLYL